MRLTKEQYREKLLDPRWQKKRLEILQRDDWACQMCTQTDKTLHVHHKVYLDGDPWDIPSELLVTLCFECHEHETEALPQAKASLLQALARVGADAFDLDCLAIAIDGLTIQAFEIIKRFAFRLTMAGGAFPVSEDDLAILTEACERIERRRKGKD